MHGPTLEREARARRFVQQLIRDLRRLGYSDDQMRGRTVLQLCRMKEEGLQHLMGPPGPAKAA